MNIAIVTNKFSIGGAETYTLRKASWLIENGHNVILISAGGEMVKFIPIHIKHYEISGIAISPYIHKKKKLNSILYELSDIFKINKIDVIEAHNANPIIYTLLSYKTHGIPYLFNDLLEFDFDHDYILRYIAKKLSKEGLFFVLTQEMLRYINELIGSDLQAEIIPIPYTKPKDKESTLDKNYFLSVARVSPEKMYVKSLIIGFGKYITSNKGCRIKKLIVVGDGDEHLVKELKLNAEEINKATGYCAVEMKGSVIGKELISLYKNCSAFIGVGTCLLISASYGKPTIIASGLKNMKEYAYGFWGTHIDIDSQSIGAKDTYVPYSVPYENILLEINDKDKADKYGKAAFDLFEKVYDMDKIMNMWLYSYANVSKYNGLELKRLPMKIIFMLPVLHFLYKIYKLGKYFQSLIYVKTKRFVIS